MFSFIDISGDICSADNSGYVVAAAATIHRRQILPLTNLIHTLKRDCLSNELLEIKATEFVNRNTLEHPELNKHRFIEQLMQKVMLEFKFSAVVMKNVPAVKTFSPNILPAYYIYLMQRINALADAQNKDALIVIDNQARSIDRWTAHAFNNYLFRSSGGRQLNKIIEMPIFADSSMTQGLQIADLAAGVIRHYYNRQLDHKVPETPFENKIFEYFSLIERRVHSSQRLQGLYLTPNDFIERNFVRS